jgi:hypothetical protein
MTLLLLIMNFKQAVRGNVSTELLPSNNRGTFTEPLPCNDKGIFDRAVA